MNRSHLHILAVFMLTLVGGCGDPVPTVEDARNIVVDGKPMEPMAFIERYCQDKTDHATCVKVRRAVSADATRSKDGPPRF